MNTRQLSESAISQLTSCLSRLTPDQLEALAAVRRAAQRGAATAMRAAQREELDLGMVALDAIIEATGGGR